MAAPPDPAARRSGSRSWPGGPRTLADLAQLTGARIEGEPEALVLGVSDPTDAGPDDLVFLLEPRYLDSVRTCPARFVLTREALPGKSCLVHPQPRQALIRLLLLFDAVQPGAGVHPRAWIDPSAKVADDASVGPGVSVGDQVEIGSGTILHPGVVLYPGARVGRSCVLHAGVVVREDCVLGDRVVVQPGAVIGSDGFGFVPTPSGIVKIPQVGNVIIEDDVEIGANTTIDRAVLGSTVIGRGTKLDNLVHLAHNVHVGENCMIVAQVGVSGSTEIGDRCVFGGQSGTVGHVRIGAETTVAARGGITKDIAGKVTVSGFPAREHREDLRRQAHHERLPGRVDRLERALEQLTDNLGTLLETALASLEVPAE